MSWLTAAVYDRWMRAAEEACLGRWRAELLQGLHGDVLEVGVGTGASLPHYPKTVTRLVLCEPDRHMRRRLQARCQSSGLRQSEIYDAQVEALPIASGSFDAVVSLLTLCSVRDMPGALAEMFRVLRPAGRFVFLEHVAADCDPGRLRWQRRIEPAWRHLAANCHLTRRTEEAIIAAGFQIERIQRESIRKAMPLARPSIRGVARKPLEGATSRRPGASGAGPGA